MKVAKGWYSDEEKLNAVALYATVGSNKELSRLTGINLNTINSWKGTEWWGECMRKIRFEMNDELDAKMTKIVDKALDQVIDRVEAGDYVIDKTGKVKRVPMKGRDLSVVTASVIDKRQLIRGEPTSISSKQTPAETRLEALAQEFAKFVKARTIEVVNESVPEAGEGTTLETVPFDQTVVPSNPSPE